MKRRFFVSLGILAFVVSAVILLPGWSQQPGRQDGKKIENPKASDQARHEVELLEAQLEVHKALIDETATRLNVAKEHLGHLQKASDAAPQSALLQARGQVEILQSQLRVKQAELRVAEVRLKHARQRVMDEHDHGKSGHDHGHVVIGERNQEIRDLQKKRLVGVTEIHSQLVKGFQGGQVPLSRVLDARAAMLRAQLDLAETKQDRIRVHEDMVKTSEEIVEITRRSAKAAQATQVDVLQAEVMLSEAKIGLERAKIAK